MRIKNHELEARDSFDYCVIGTGPAGITCALSLADKGHRVALLEGGGEEYSDWSQDLYSGNVTGDPYFDLDTARLRYFGGTSNHWGGWCRTLDAIDFEAKENFSQTKWPISKSDLDPFFAKAAEILEIPPVPAKKPFFESGFHLAGFAFSPPVRFREKYNEPLSSHPNIFLAFDANLMEFETDGGSVSAALIRSSGGDEYRVKAGRFILATGGIENSRLLLWGNERSNGKLVKNPKALGRYWMEHPTYTIGETLFVGDMAAFANKSEEIFLAPSAQTIRDAGSLNCGFRLYPSPYSGVKKMILDIACVAPKVAYWLGDLADKKLVCGGKIRASWEQEPRFENRITLSAERDALGMPRTELIWTKTEADRRTPAILAQKFGEYLARANHGRLRLYPWMTGDSDFPEDGEIGGYHHMGGTRMADNPDEGIVDRNCRVHGQSNLYIAGSSVFPSGGYANPTLPIVQLSLRLADHLNQG